MPTIWSYSDNADRGYGIFKRRMFSALEKNGWQTELIEAPLLEPSSQKILRQHFLDNIPEWILLVNQTVSQFYDYLTIQPNPAMSNIKKLVWFLDNPKFFVTQPFEKNEYVMCFDETYMDDIIPMCSRPPIFFPLATDQSRAGLYRESHRCEVCFVGGVIDQSNRRNQLSPPMVEYVDRLVQKKILFPQKRFDELIVEFPIESGKEIRLTNDVEHYLYWETNNRYRIQVLEALQDYDLRIYGNEDWGILLQDSPLQERFFGRADPMQDLPSIFVSSQINLNIHSVQCLGSLNQRDFNAPVCGGFLLSDWVPAAGKYFRPGEEAVYWCGIDDLKSKIDYYLKHPQKRNAIVESGRLRVYQNHTYPKRVQELLQVLNLS